MAKGLVFWCSGVRILILVLVLITNLNNKDVARRARAEGLQGSAEGYIVAWGGNPGWRLSVPFWPSVQTLQQATAAADVTL